MSVVRFLLKVPFKILLIPVWLLLAAAWAVVGLFVNIYGGGRAVVSFFLTLLLIGVIVCYQDWVQAAVLIVMYLLLFIVLFIGTALQVILEEIWEKVGELILL